MKLGEHDITVHSLHNDNKISHPCYITKFRTSKTIQKVKTFSEKITDLSLAYLCAGNYRVSANSNFLLHFFRPS